MLPLLHLRSSQGVYGADRVILALASATPEPFSPVIAPIVREGRSSALAEAARDGGLDVHLIPSRGRGDPAGVLRLAALLRERGIRLVHAHDYKALWLGGLAGALARVPVVATFHGDTRATLALRVYEGIGRLCGNLTRGVAAVSRSLAEELARWIPLARVVHIPNGLPPVEPCTGAEREQARRELGVAPGGPVIAVVGRLSPEKGHSVLFEALVRMERPPTVLIAGDGPLRPRLEEAGRSLEVRWLGYRASTRPVYAAADLVVMPSLTEGLPMVALEAMAHGRCLVASSVGGLLELLEGGAGVLVPPRDPAALAGALERLCGDPAGCRAVADRALERLRERHGAGAMAGAYVRELYRPALG